MSVPYSYSPLPGPDHIRLAVLKPGKFDDELRVVLITTKFSRAQRLGYEALSYVWGTQSDLSRVRILHTSATKSWHLPSHHKITQNLDQALRYLRYTTKPCTLWIDALCINQDDDNEKAVQVRKMGRIYSRAGRVVVWLGPAAPHIRVAMDWMEWIERQLEIDWKIKMVKRKDTDIDGELWHEGAVLLDPKLARGILHLLQAPWFHRVWVRQEIYLANQDQARVLCGSFDTSWIAFHTGLGVLCEMENRIRVNHVTGAFSKTDETIFLEWSIHNALSDLRAFIFQKSAFGLVGLRAAFGNATCHDDRDRIFAALDMVTARDADIIGAPDYTSDVSHVYTNVAARWYRNRAEARLLTQCSLEEATTKRMPSWVPDWSQPLPTWPFSSMSTADLAAPISLADTPSTGLGFGSVLSVYGIPGPLITQLGTVLPNPKGGWADLPALLTTLFPLSCFDHLEPQSSGGLPGTTVLGQYATVLCGGYLRECYRPPDLRYNSLRDAVSVLLTWLRLETTSDVNAHTDAFNLLPRDAAEVTFFERAYTTLRGRRLALGSRGEIMPVPASARLGDRICVLLGCDYPMLLRPSNFSDQPDAVRYQVIGSCFVDGMQFGGALLGPLPPGIACVLDDEVGEYVWIDSATNEVIATEDPRLEPFLKKLPKGVADGFRNRQHPFVHLDHAHLDILQAHRLEVSAPGGDLQVFHLI